MVDGESVNLYNDIVYRFSNSRFPEFANLPKIFAFDSCQLFGATEASMDIDLTPDILNDTLVLLPCIPGGESARPAYGEPSIFIRCLVEGLKKFAKGVHLNDIVQKEVAFSFKSCNMFEISI